MEAASGSEPMVKYWLHTGFLNVGGRKMSKSLGNFITIRDALKKWDVDTMRLMSVSTHYRSPINYTEAAMEQAKNSLNYIRGATKAAKKEVDVRKWIEKFVDAMDDDFNTPKVVALLLEMAKRINKTEEDLSPAIYEIGDVLGIDFRLKERPLPPELMTLIKKREELRKQKRWDEADRIREEVKKKGILLKDTPEGTEWVFKNN
jgi:Cysteinyl-tRNA synthetase